MLQRKLTHGRRRDLLAAPRNAIGLTDYQRHAPYFSQHAQDRKSKRARAKEHHIGKRGSPV